MVVEQGGQKNKMGSRLSALESHFCHHPVWYWVAFYMVKNSQHSVALCTRIFVVGKVCKARIKRVFPEYRDSKHVS